MGVAVSTEIMILCEWSMVPEMLIILGPVCMLHTYFECLIRCVRFLIFYGLRVFSSLVLRLRTVILCVFTSISF
jgi:hypothetical protein